MSNTGHDDVKAQQRDGSSPLVGLVMGSKGPFHELIEAIELEANYQQAEIDWLNYLDDQSR